MSEQLLFCDLIIHRMSYRLKKFQPCIKKYFLGLAEERKEFFDHALAHYREAEKYFLSH